MRLLSTLMRCGKSFRRPPEYFEGPYQRSRDELREIQNERFLRQMERAWQVPFYQNTGAAGMSRAISAPSTTCEGSSVLRSRPASRA